MPGARRIIAGVSGSPGSVHTLRLAADLARDHDAVLIPVLAWVPPDGDRHERRHPCPELRQLWKDDAWQRLQDALGTAFGGLPAGIVTQPAVLRGKPGKVLVSTARQPGDLLVIGVGRPGPLLPGSRPLPGAGHPGPRPGPGRGLRPARLGVPAPLGQGNSTARIAT
jgi:nucleotide-binding universal stress UspA family protein